MDFRTRIPLKKQNHNQIDYNSKLLLIGSCFSENIGKKLAYYKLQSTVNPFGILFHPKAIEQFISDTVNERKFTEKDIFYHNERWLYFNAHSSISSTNKNELLQNLNSITNVTFQQLKKVTHIVFTLGTSWIYKHIKSNKIVANCHKIPQKEFSKEILSTNEASTSLQTINSLIHSVNKKANIIYTVSPVRHLKDGFIENQQSKSQLISAIHQIENPNTFYFPSYEIMMDELRDYRFYKEDMIHPNLTAIHYIWKQFCEVWFNPSTKDTMKEINTIQKGLAHRSFNPNTNEYQLFIQKIQQKIEVLQQKHPFMSF